MKFSKKEIFTIPNILTYIRLLCVPFFIWLMLDSSIGGGAGWNVWIALGLFAFAELTDLIDGYVARKFNMGSDIGKIIDPIADKLLQVSALICLAIIGRVHWAFALIILVKELYMTFGSIIVLKLVGTDVNVQANFWGKFAGALFTGGCILSFFHIEKFKNLFYIDWAILAAACAVAIYAAIQYTIVIVAQVKLAKQKPTDAAIDNKEKTE